MNFKRAHSYLIAQTGNAITRPRLGYVIIKAYIALSLKSKGIARHRNVFLTMESNHRLSDGMCIDRLLENYARFSELTFHEGFTQEDLDATD